MKLTIRINIILLFSIVLYLHGFSQSCVVCNNADFESGTGGGWTYSDGSDSKSTGCNNSPNFCIQSNGFNPPQHVLQTLGSFDPMVGGTILPVVPPFGGNQSLRLGDGNAVMGDGGGVQSKAARATFTYLVQPATANFTYRYAVVVEEPATGFPNHNDDERPFFNVAVRDAAGNKISCGDLYVVARPPMTDFTQTNNHTRNVWYRGWSTVVLPFAAYIGQCVSIEFSTGDCALGAHFGYAYIDASCNAAEVVTSTANACGGYKLAAPTNASGYKWTNKASGDKAGIEGPDDKQTVDVNKAGTYQVVMSSLAGPNCMTTLEITVGDPGPSPASFTPFTGCAGSFTQFTDTSTPNEPATGWAWDFNNDALDDAVIKNPTHVFPANGTYPVRLTIFSGNCSASITQDVYVDIPIYPAVDPAGPFCVSAAPVTLTASIPGGTWSGPGITDAVAGVFTPAAGIIGNNQIIYATPASCPGKDTITIVVNAPISDAGRDITICTGSTGNLGAPVLPNYSYSWAPATGLNSAIYANPTVTLNNNSTTPTISSYTVTTKNTISNCVATDVVDVTVNPLPIVNAGPDQTICEGSIVLLNGSAAGATTSYTWSGGSGTYNPGNTVLNSIYTSNLFEVSMGSLNLTLTSNDPIGPCPAATDQMRINISPKPTVDAGIDQTICIGSLVNLAGSIGGSATSATWSGGAGQFIPNNTNPDATYAPTSAEEAAGVFTLTYTTNDPPGECSFISDDIKITINQLPTANAGADQTICSGSVTLNGSIGGSATSMVWSGGSGTYNPNSTTPNCSYTPSASEIATGGVTLTITTNIVGSCPPGSDQMAIKINQMPIVNAGSNQNICINSIKANNIVILGASFGGSAAGGTWSGGVGTFTPDNTDPNATYTLNESEAQNPNIALIYTTDDPAGPCPAVSDQMIIQLDQVPIINAGPDQTICAGSTVTLSGSQSGSVSAVTWSGGAGSYNPNNTSLSCVYTPTSGEIALGNIVLTLTTDDPAGPCSSVNDQMVIVINPPALANVGADKTICSGSTIALTGIYNGSATSGSWSGGSGNYNPNNNASNPVYSPSGQEMLAGKATLIYTTDDPIGPCPAATDQMLLTINAMPTIDAGNIIPSCIGSSVSLKGIPGGAASSATWSGGLGEYSPGNKAITSYTPSESEYAAGTILLTLTTNDPAGPCPAVSDNVTINFLPLPTALFVVDDRDGCPVHCVKYTDFSSVTGGSTITKWKWNFGDGSGSEEPSPSHCYKNTGKYDVELSVTDNNGCPANLKYDKYITVFKEPIAEFEATPNPASVLDHNVTFLNRSSSDVNFWKWSFGDGDTIAPHTINPIHEYPSENAEKYNVTLQVHNTDFCFAIVEHIIKIEPAFSFFIPNAFTPRASAGVNDTFFGKGIGIVEYDFWIFDRWGDEIFHTKNLDEGWDGKANEGKHTAQRDVYVWKVHLIDVFKKPHDYIGTVTLVR